MSDDQTKPFNAQEEIAAIKRRLEVIEAALQQLGRTMKYAGNMMTNGGQ